MKTLTLILALLLTPAVSRAADCTLGLDAVDASSGESIPAVIQIRDAQDAIVPLKGLLPRGLGIKEGPSIHDWYVLAEPTDVTVPQGKLTLRAFQGLETELGSVEIDTTGREAAKVQVPLKRFYSARDAGWQSGNTHLHLQKLSRRQADRYLVDVSRADGLDLVFVSYLERAIADLEYTTNKYTREDFERLSSQYVVFDNGEEHRHNFSAFEEGYGHVMLLHLQRLVQPVSIGAGIMKQGTDGIPLQRGIDTAREMGATIIWCHNKWGHEDLPNWFSGRLHANNIFDGGTHGSFKHSFYPLLNVGLRVPFSTGTDWFMYDFSRVYVPAQQRLSPTDWLEQLRQGRSIITNGPLLELTVDDKPIGETLNLPQPGKVRVRATARSRVDFETLQLIHNGRVVNQAESRPEGEHFKAEMDVEVSIDEPSWLAARTPPPSDAKDPEFQVKRPLNEYGRELFSHTSGVYVQLAGRDVFHRPTAEALLAEMQQSRAFIAGRGKFANEEERTAVLAVYDRAIQQFAKRMEAKTAAQ